MVLFMKVNGCRVSKVEKGISIGQTDQFIQENGEKISQMEKDNCNIQKAMSMMVNGSTAGLLDMVDIPIIIFRELALLL